MVSSSPLHWPFWQTLSLSSGAGPVRMAQRWHTDAYEVTKIDANIHRHCQGKAVKNACVLEDDFKRSCTCRAHWRLVSSKVEISLQKKTIQKLRSLGEGILHAEEKGFIDQFSKRFLKVMNFVENSPVFQQFLRRSSGKTKKTKICKILKCPRFRNGNCRIFNKMIFLKLEKR